jgi:TM2 domain-containing membrane protein YozV
MNSEKNWVIALLLCVFLGGIGAHRFYVGKIGTGILYLFTAGLLGIGWLVDLILILVGKFKDKEGKMLKPK